MPRALLIVNPVSGRGRGRSLAPRLADSLRQRGLGTEVFFTEKEGDGKAKAASANGDVALIVAAGGDGTLNEVLNGLRREIPLALFPLGTANVLALELGLPRTAEEFAEMLGRGRLLPIDTLRANGRLGFFAVGVGFDGMVIEELKRRRRGPIGKWSYLGPIWRAIRSYETPRLRVHIDGEAFDDVSFALVANTRNYGGSVFQLSPERRLDDGLFECYLFRGRGRGALLRYLFRGVSHRLLECGDPLVRKGKRIRIESADPAREIPWEIDGEFGGRTPVEIEVIPRGMQVIVP